MRFCAIVCATAAIVLLAPRSALASCMAPTQCAVSTAVVLSCEVLEPHKEKSIVRVAAEYRREGLARRARELFESYRGVIVEVRETKRETGDCELGRPSQPYDVAGYGLGSRFWFLIKKKKKETRTFYFPTTEGKQTCLARFPANRELRIFEAFACCDGDPGPPCLLSRD
jgi:hypothetical protein